MEKVLVVAAHPDDEALGCGGTMALHADTGDIVQVVFLADGLGARDRRKIEKREILKRQTAAIRASKILGATTPLFLAFPDNQLDTVPLLSVIKEIETIAAKFKPTIVYTHHAGDLNVDHRICHESVMTAFRPVPGQRVKSIYAFEVLSSTNWSSSTALKTFIPNRFCDITIPMKAKINALKEYDSELRQYPHARSIEATTILAQYRGASVGFHMAEAFFVERQLLDFANHIPSSVKKRSRAPR